MANPSGTVNDLISQMKIQHHMDHHDNERPNAACYTQEKTIQYGHNNANKTHFKQMSNTKTCTYCKKEGHV